MRNLLTLTALAATGCAVTPTDVRQTAPTASYERPGTVAKVADCFGMALERDLGFETVVRRPQPDTAEISAWGGGLERKTIFVVTLEDQAGGLRTTVYRNPYVLMSIRPEPVIERSLASCVR